MAREPRPGEPDAAHDLETWLSSASLARRYLALGHPDVPVPVLERAAASLCWPERLAAAVHPRTPRSVVEELASDACRWVRSSIAQDESTTVP